MDLSQDEHGDLANLLRHTILETDRLLVTDAEASDRDLLRMVLLNQFALLQIIGKMNGMDSNPKACAADLPPEYRDDA